LVVDQSRIYRRSLAGIGRLANDERERRARPRARTRRAHRHPSSRGGYDGPGPLAPARDGARHPVLALGRRCGGRPVGGRLPFQRSPGREVSQAWLDLVPAKTAEEQLKVAEAHPKTPVADWARLRAAFEEYDSGLVDLTTPGKKETAGPRLKKALELFQQVAAEAPQDSSQAIGAAFGVARTLEARNELPEAIKQYKLVASTWPGTPEARQAESLAKALEDPENATFYKELYAYKPPPGTSGNSPLTLPPGGSGTFDIKSLLRDIPPPGPGPAPADLAPPPPLGPAPGAPTPPATAPTPARPEDARPADAPKGELPADPFAPPK
jgi:hypothetical protein